MRAGQAGQAGRWRCLLMRGTRRFGISRVGCKHAHYLVLGSWIGVRIFPEDLFANCIAEPGYNDQETFDGD